MKILSGCVLPGAEHSYFQNLEHFSLKCDALQTHLWEQNTTPPNTLHPSSRSLCATGKCSVSDMGHPASFVLVHPRYDGQSCHPLWKWYDGPWVLCRSQCNLHVLLEGPDRHAGRHPVCQDAGQFLYLRILGDSGLI